MRRRTSCFPLLIFQVSCLVVIVTGHSIAQNANLTLDPPTPAPNHATASVETPAFSARKFMLDQSANRSAGKDDSPEQPIYACACGCGIFDVGTSSMFPHGQGGMVWQEWDYMDQNRNHRGASQAPAAENDDRDVRTDFFTTGVQCFFNRKWGLQAEIPVDHRHFETSDAGYNWTALGDIRIKGLYTGFSEDQSIGINVGVKLPTGNFTHPGPDRDTQIGSGSTDILLGGFFRKNLSADGTWTFFTQLEADIPLLIQDHYRPGFEVDGAAGVYYSGFLFHGVTISPVGQVLLSYRSSDEERNSANPVASGYERVLLSPGIEFDMHPFSVYADVEIPVYQYFKGDQLAAPALFKVMLSYRF